MKKFLAAALASMMLIGGAALASADGELNICSPNSDGLLSIIPVFEEQTGIKVKVESIGTGDCMKRIGSEIAHRSKKFAIAVLRSRSRFLALKPSKVETSMMVGATMGVVGNTNASKSAKHASMARTRLLRSSSIVA